MTGVPATKFTQFLLQHFREWEKLQGMRMPEAAFAEYLGFNKSLVNRWMNGKTPPSPEHAFELALRLKTLEVYDALDIPEEKPDETLFRLQVNWEQFSESEQERIGEMLESVEKRQAQQAAKAAQSKPKPSGRAS